MNTRAANDGDYAWATPIQPEWSQNAPFGAAFRFANTGSATRCAFWEGSDTSLLLATALCGLAFALLAGFEGGLLGAVMVWAVCALIGVFLLSFEAGSDWFGSCLRIFWVTYCLRTTVMVALHLALGLTPDGPWWNFGDSGGDELLFWTRSDDTLWAWRTGSFANLPNLTNGPLWVHMIGFTRYFGWLFDGNAEHVVLARLPLCLGSALIVPYVYLLARRVFDEPTGRAAAALAFWFPEFWFYASTLMRDILIPALLIVIVHQVVEMVSVGVRWRRFALAVVLNFAVLRYIRNDIAFISLGMALLFAIWAQTWRGLSTSRRVVSTLALGALMLAVLSFVAPDIYSPQALALDPRLSRWYLDHRLNVERDLASVQASSASLGRYVLALPMVLGVPAYAGVVMINPFPPWAGVIGRGFSPLQATVVLICASVWCWVLPYLAAGLLDAFRQARRTIWVWGPVIGIALALGATVSTHARWRLALMPFALVLVARGRLTAQSHRAVIISVALVLVAGIVAHTVLKALG
jgi:hypothetical protein